MSIENLLFSAGSGFLFGAEAGYAIKKVMKIAAVIWIVYSWSLLFIIQRMDRCKMDGNGECYKDHTD